MRHRQNKPTWRAQQGHLYLGAKRSLLGKSLSDEARIKALPGLGPFYDFSDKSTMFQDSAGTLPVTALNQPVGLVLDKSGKGIALDQPTTINRPIYALDSKGKPSLSFNGTNQWLKTAINLNLSGTAGVTVASSWLTASNAISIIHELSSAASNIGGFYLATNVAAAGSIRILETTSAGQFFLDITAPLGAAHVAVAQYSIATPNLAANLDQQSKQQTTGVSGTWNFLNAIFYVGARAGSASFFNGNLHTLAIRGALSTQPEIELLARFANSRAGAYT